MMSKLLVKESEETQSILSAHTTFLISFEPCLHPSTVPDGNDTDSGGPGAEPSQSLCLPCRVLESVPGPGHCHLLSPPSQVSLCPTR